jgi:hypothetical protein
MPHRIPVRCRELSRIPGATCLTQCETSHAPGSRGDLPNGCDGFLHCGTCSGLETCGGEAPNVCACTPRACPADASWSCEDTSLPTDRQVALDGSAKDDLGVVGKLGAPAHRDGTGWTARSVGPSAVASSLSMASAAEGRPRAAGWCDAPRPERKR